MIKIGCQTFGEVWIVDFEFSKKSGDKPIPICMAAYEVGTCKKIRTFEDDLISMKAPPYPTDSESLFVAYYASAEMACHIALGWEFPANVLDLFAEFRCLTNGLNTPCGNGLLGAMASFGLGSVGVIEKESMRKLALRGGPWSSEERIALINYCMSDVNALTQLLKVMEPLLDMPRALLRGRYMKAVARIEFNGVPIDIKTLRSLHERWNDIQDELVSRIDANYDVYDGRSFRMKRFESWLRRNDIPWPRLNSGQLDLKDDTFKEMAKVYPIITPLRELRIVLSQMRLSEIAVGNDGRNRCILSAFRSRTGRNQPSNNNFIFGPAVWLRGLIRPELACGMAYIDWSQQEFGIAAALSQDTLMLEAYKSGDPYLAFAKQAGAVPQDATKKSHRIERELFKACVLAVQYGMGEESLASRIGKPVIFARELLQRHRSTYRVFWKWSEGVLNYALLHGKLWAAFGWNVNVIPNPNPRFLLNFPMQANGAEMLRIACCLAVEWGIKVCAPIHDALLIEVPLENLDKAISLTQKAMSDASAAVLNGFRLRTDVKVVKHPDRYMDERGEEMWNTIMGILQEY